MSEKSKSWCRSCGPILSVCGANVTYWTLDQATKSQYICLHTVTSLKVKVWRKSVLSPFYWPSWLPPSFPKHYDQSFATSSPKNITIHVTNTSAVQPFNFKPIQLSHQELFWPRSKYFHICGWWKQLDLHNHNLRTPSWFAQIFTFNESHPFGQFSSSSRFFLAVA